jgi:hypothetical protein
MERREEDQICQTGKQRGDVLTVKLLFLWSLQMEGAVRL